MATPTKPRAGDNLAPPWRTRQPSRWRRNLVLLVLLLGAVALGWAWRSLRGQALVAAAYGARTGCVCRFVSQRPLKSCTGAVEAAGLGRVGRLVSLSEDTANRTITAGVPSLASQRATFDGKGGCQLEPWAD